MRVSHSRVNTFMACPKKYDIVYNKKLQLLEDKDALAIGKAVHHGIEMHGKKNEDKQVMDGAEEAVKYYESNESFSSEKNETNKVLVEAMTAGYIKRYGVSDVKENEAEITCDIGDGDEMIAILDLIVKEKSKTGIVDIKTSSMLKDADDHKPQTIKYAYAYNHKYNKAPDFIKIRSIIKSKIRQKQNESIQEFRGRLIEEYETNPDKYYHEQQIEFSPFDIAKEMMEFKSGVQLMKIAIANGLYPRNLTSCSMYGSCEFKPLCQGLRGAEDLYVSREETVKIEDKTLVDEDTLLTLAEEVEKKFEVVNKQIEETNKKISTIENDIYE